MKCMLWFAVPFAGVHSKLYKRFQNKLLHLSNFAGKTDPILDPRYKEIRSYLVSCYERAVKEWGMDGLKLDFIDCFRLESDSAPYNDEMDLYTVEQGVISLLQEIKCRLLAVKPDIMLEFRQRYVGPVMQQYGNMFRVGDCPNDALSNRIGIIDLRLTSDTAAVHSDMLMWNKNASVEQAAMQLANILFGVPQISVLLDELPEEHRQMLMQYLTFWNEYRDVLLEGCLIPYDPAACYSLVSAKNGKRAVHVVYSRNYVKIDTENAVTVNASGYDFVFLETDGKYTYNVIDCMGRSYSSGVLEKGYTKIMIPVGGFIYVTQIYI